MAEVNEVIATENDPEKKLPPRRNVGWIFILLLFILVGFSLGLGYVTLSKFKKTIRTIKLAQQTALSQNHEDILGLQKNLTELQQKLQKSEQLFTQQEQLVNELRSAQGGLEKWHVAEAQYLVKLANDHIQFKHDLPMAENLLQRADQVLQNNENPKIIELRQSIANDLASLQSFPKVDITGLYVRLIALDQQIDQLPFPSQPLAAQQKQTSSIPPDLPWWKKGLDRFWESLSQIVIVRYADDKSLPILLPEQKTFLYQNLHAQMENAMWGLLHRHPEIYQQSLNLLETWIKNYFAQAENTQAFLQSIQNLSHENIQPPTVNLTSTLQLFDNYFIDVKKDMGTT